jgi:glycosyltransferase involved in cell wall biosynthesis
MDSENYVGEVDQAVPRVSVVMAIGRGDAYLGPAISSILSQSFQDFEFLIVVDAGIAEVREDLKREYGHLSKVRILESPSLGGIALALNLGIGRARGEYIARMDGDDISLPLRLERQVKYLDEHPNTAVLGCRVRLIGAESEDLRQTYSFYGSNRAIRRMLPLRSPMVHPALMIRKTALFAVGGYKYCHSAEDHEMYLRMARDPKLEFENLSEILFEYRRHDSQGTNDAFYKRRYSEMGGYLFTEFIRSHSPAYLVGIIGIHPWARRIRSLLKGK